MIIKKLKNTKVKKVTIGGGNGSIMLLDLIDIKNNKFILYIYSTWRLHQKGKIVTSNDDFTLQDNEGVVQLKSLENKEITGVSCSQLGDVRLVFDSKIELDVFCDLTYSEEGLYENWSVCDLSNNLCENWTDSFDISKEAYE